ncbi:uncharacterized protein LOC126679731 isoform X2 [Mercurialis annua]|uniref:uncharacterized protein LOC126679731 isoform X2 n=1 Tax=Mercurialis annua TaxID=3986 RepID=UPI0024ACFDA6|nr:uncharacterized protein LOC126679731 isoform X2 [Mercurialis annua]
MKSVFSCSRGQRSDDNLSAATMLQDHLHEMQIELDNLAWDRKELQHQLHTSIKECRILESMLAEVEDENDNLIAKFELLQDELQDLKVENQQLKENFVKDRSSKKSASRDNAQKTDIADTIHYSISDGRGQTCYKATGIIFEDLAMLKNAWESQGKSEAELLTFLKTKCAATESFSSFSRSVNSSSVDIDEGLNERRDAALSQSLFSAVLSLLVGIIIWKAADPCMPLVVALFAVVGMSLKSVVQFFSTINNKPASDAVALLSFNWFMLGTLTYPALPKVARMLTPLTFNIFYWIVR